MQAVGHDRRQAVGLQDGPGARTAWQHDVVSLGENRYSVFDNGAGDTGTRVLRD